MIPNDHAELVVHRAREAAKFWWSKDMQYRMDKLHQLQKAFLLHHDQFIDAIVKDIQQPPIDALAAEILPILDTLHYYRKHAPRLLSRQHRRSPWYMWGARSMVEYMPYGVVLIIAPWNFPLQLSFIPAICALAAGNAVIIKPSEQLQHVPQAIMDMLKDAMLPSNLIQVVTGGPNVAKELISSHPDKIFFTGRESSGKSVAKLAAQSGIPTALELSGNSPMIVFADANLKRAAKAAVWGGFFHAGQVCISIERIYVETSVQSQFTELLIEEAKKLKPYTPSFHDQEENSLYQDGDLGPILMETDWVRLNRLLDNAIHQGATIAWGKTENDDFPYFPPTVLISATDSMEIMNEETFGPLVAVTPFSKEDEVIKRINAGRFGLNVTIFTSDHKKGERIASQLQTGCCVINDVIRNISNSDLPFGGVKASGYGRYRGSEGLYEFTQTKSIMIHSGKRTREINWFPYQIKNLKALQKLLKWWYR